MKHIYLISSILACIVLIGILVAFLIKGSPGSGDISKISDMTASCAPNKGGIVSNYNFDFSSEKLSDNSDLIRSKADNFSIIVQSDADASTTDMPSSSNGLVTIQRNAASAFYLVNIYKAGSGCITSDYAGIVPDESIERDLGSDYFSDAQLLERPMSKVIAQWGKKIESAKYLVREAKIQKQGYTFVASASEYVTASDNYVLFEVMTTKHDTAIRYLAVLNTGKGTIAPKDAQGALELMAQNKILLQ